jgi:hypothetical protein
MDALNIQQSVVLNIQILHQILQAIKEVKQFKRQCVELGNIVGLLLLVMDADQDDSSNAGNEPTSAVQRQQKRPSAFRDANTSARLKQTLDEIHVFVGKCLIDRGNLLQRGWEIFIDRNLPRLKQELFHWIAVCTMETTVKASVPSCLDLGSLRITSKGSHQKRTAHEN